MGVQVKAAVNSVLEHSESNNFSQLLPKVGLSYRIDDRGSNVYATVSKGYRAGGYNFQMFSDILQTELQDKAQSARGDMTIEHSEQDYSNIAETISYKPEESWNYEFGTHLNLFDGRLHADFAGFYMQVRNQQLSVMAGNYGFGRMMVNAGKSYSCGIELTLRGSAFDNRLTWGAAYGYTRAVFKDYVDSVRVEGVNTAVDYKDKRVPYVPEHTFSVMADYRIGQFTIGANVAAQGRIFWNEANTYSQKFYATLGAHVDYAFTDNIGVSLWGRNLTDTNYNTFAVASAATGRQMYFAQRANPIQVGIDVNIHF
jgi:outer membrane receptor protein involved in Fe transport